MSRRRIKHELPPNVALAFGELKSDYNAARTSRTRKRLVGVSSMGSGADYHVRSEVANLRMMEQAREFDRNDVIVGQGITRLIDSVLQKGIRLDPKTGDAELDANLSKRWKEWTGKPELCDAAKEHSFAWLARLAMRGMIVDGDSFALPLTTGSVELVEAHRVRRSRRTEKNVVHGILLSEQRERLECWITKEDLNPNAPGPTLAGIRRVPMRNSRGERQVLQVYNSRRVSQTRGVTALAPTVDMIGMHDDIQFATLVKTQVASCFAIFHEFADGTVSTPAAQTGEREEETRGDGSTRTVEGISPGMKVQGLPGETLKGFSPNIPNPEFFPHAMLILTFIAINLNMPVHMLLLDPSKTNFSGWRGAMDLARVGFRELQALMIEKFHEPIYLWKVRQWITEDAKLQAALGRDVDIFGHRWSPPSWPYMEPKKDAEADNTIIESRLDSRRGVLNKNGKDIDDVDRELVADNERLIISAAEAAERINQKHPDAAVDWRELIYFDSKGRQEDAEEVEEKKSAEGKDDV